MCLFNVWYSSVTQLPVFCLLQSRFSFFFASHKDTHTYTHCSLARLCVSGSQASSQPWAALSLPAALQASCHPPLLKHKMSLGSGMQIRTRSFIPCSCWPLYPPPPSRPLRAEDEDLGSEAAVGSLTGHQQSTHQITEHVQVGRIKRIFIVLRVFFF